MPGLEDSDPPEFIKYVNKKVTLDMLSTDELIQELVDRQCLIVLKAFRRVPQETYIKDNFYSAMQAILSCDLGKRLVSDKLIAEEVVQGKDYLEFISTIVVLQPIEEDRPV